MRTSNETRVKMLPEKRTVVGTEEKSLVCHWSLGLLVCVSVHAACSTCFVVSTVR
jgi:hypothetical protein